MRSISNKCGRTHQTSICIHKFSGQPTELGATVKKSLSFAILWYRARRIVLTGGTKKGTSARQRKRTYSLGFGRSHNPLGVTDDLVRIRDRLIHSWHDN